MILFEKHLTLPRLLEVLLHNLLLLLHCLMLKVLSLDLVLDELFVRGTLDLTIGLVHFKVHFNLMCQILTQELLLTFLGIQGTLDLIEGLLRAEVRLVVEVLDFVFCFFHALFLCDLVEYVVLI